MYSTSAELASLNHCAVPFLAGLVPTCAGATLFVVSRESPGTQYRYCEATEGCKNARQLTDNWRVNSRRIVTGRYESTYFGNDGWVHFSEGLKRLPEAPPPKSVGGLNNFWSISKSIFVNAV